MSIGEENLHQNGGTEIDEVVIDGKSYRVRKEIVDEIVALRKAGTAAYANRMRAVEPKETETVVITTPENVSAEFMAQVLDGAKASFPDRGLAIMPEGLRLHTVEGLRELVRAGFSLASELVSQQDDAGLPESAQKALREWKEITEGREDAGEGDGAADGG